jgi:predicted enzyme related to lactoylglutathione lyase
MVTFDCADPRRLAAFWAAALDTKVAGDYGDFVFLAPPQAGGTTLGFQRVPEPRVGKNRVHVDLLTADRVAEVARLVGLGAAVSYDQVGVVPGIDWTTLTDPEGNVFCVSQQAEPAPTG